MIGVDVVVEALGWTAVGGVAGLLLIALLSGPFTMVVLFDWFHDLWERIHPGSRATPSTQSLLQDYYKSKAELRQLEQKAWQDEWDASLPLAERPGPLCGKVGHGVKGWDVDDYSYGGRHSYSIFTCPQCEALTKAREDSQRRPMAINLTAGRVCSHPASQRVAYETTWPGEAVLWGCLSCGERIRS